IEICGTRDAMTSVLIVGPSGLPRGMPTAGLGVAISQPRAESEIGDGAGTRYARGRERSVRQAAAVRRKVKRSARLPFGWARTAARSRVDPELRLARLCEERWEVQRTPAEARVSIAGTVVPVASAAPIRPRDSGPLAPPKAF